MSESTAASQVGEGPLKESLMDGSCRGFAAALADRTSVPGGGGAAAYVGALAAALCAMTGNFTVGKKAYAAVEDEVAALVARADEERERLVALVDADARGFEPLARAYGIPKDDPARPRLLEEATRAACAAPLEMMQRTCAVIGLLEDMARVGSKMLASDVACGAYLARAALEAASVNVFVNAKALADRDCARQLEAECDRMLGEYAPRAQAVAAGVVRGLRG